MRKNLLLVVEETEGMLIDKETGEIFISSMPAFKIFKILTAIADKGSTFEVTINY
jgi:myo-inositol-hexaphosphate 3-phosphohydrolase